MIDVGMLEVHHPDGQVFTFEPGSLGLAFAVTGPGTNEGVLAHFQTLRRPYDLERWASDVVGIAGLHATDDDLELAVRLQAAIWSVADALIDRRPVPDGDLELLNELAAQPCLVPRLLPGPTRAWVGVEGVRSLISSVARDAVDVLDGHGRPRGVPQPRRPAPEPGVQQRRRGLGQRPNDLHRWPGRGRRRGEHR